MVAANRIGWVVIGVLVSALAAGCATNGLQTASTTKHYRRAKTEKTVARRQAPARIETGSIDKVSPGNATANTATAPIDHGDAPRYDRAVPSPDRNGTAPAATTDTARGGINPSEPVTSRDDPRWRWCEQRHLDYQAGRAPGGATELSKKLEDDRICAAVYERG